MKPDGDSVKNLNKKKLGAESEEPTDHYAGTSITRVAASSGNSVLNLPPNATRRNASHRDKREILGQK